MTEDKTCAKALASIMNKRATLAKLRSDRADACKKIKNSQSRERAVGRGKWLYCFAAAKVAAAGR